VKSQSQHWSHHKSSLTLSLLYEEFDRHLLRNRQILITKGYDVNHLSHLQTNAQYRTLIYHGPKNGEPRAMDWMWLIQRFQPLNVLPEMHKYIVPQIIPSARINGCTFQVHVKIANIPTTFKVQKTIQLHMHVKRPTFQLHLKCKKQSNYICMSKDQHSNYI
jgi:hypothetical protein